MKAINRAGNLKRICNHTRRRTRREQATARQLVYNALTLQAKLDAISKRPGESKREKERLLNELPKV